MGRAKTIRQALQEFPKHDRKRGIIIKEISNKCNVTSGSIINWEKGKERLKNMDVIIPLAEYLGCTEREVYDATLKEFNEYKKREAEHVQCL